jgi:hypothetical protein
MISRLSILVFLSGMPSISIPASIVNIDFFSTDQNQQKSESTHETSDQQRYENDSQNYAILKKNKSPSAQESHSFIYDVNHSNETGFFKSRLFQDQIQNSADESIRALDEIKTSLKGINNEWNKIEDRAFLLLEMGNMNISVNSATAETNLLGSISHKGQYVDTPTSHLETLADRQDPAVIEEQLQDQPLLYQLLFFISIPRLLTLISANLTSLILIVLLWLFIKGVIEFVRWKMKKKKRSRIKRKRSIDGFTKY